MQVQLEPSSGRLGRVQRVGTGHDFGKLLRNFSLAGGVAQADVVQRREELARSRAAALSNVRYEMALSLARRDTARGTVTVRFNAARSADVILDFRGPWIGAVRVNGGEAKTEFNGAHLRIPARAVRAGPNVVEDDD